MTGTELTERYAVHELLIPSDPRTSCGTNEMHVGELPGRDILCDGNNLWHTFASDADIEVDAGPVAHRGMNIKALCPFTRAAHRTDSLQYRVLGMCSAR